MRKWFANYWSRAIVLGIFAPTAVASVLMIANPLDASRELPVVVAFLLLAFVFEIVGFVHWGRSDRSYFGFIYATAPLIPGFGAAAAAATYLSQVPGTSLSRMSIFVGFVVAFAAWLGGAQIPRKFSTPDSADTRAFGRLTSRFGALKVRWEIARSLPTPVGTSEYAASVARATLVENVSVIENELWGPGRVATLLRWVDSTGYVILWDQILRAEEALIYLEPVQDVVAAARRDRRVIETEVSEGRLPAPVAGDLRKAIRQMESDDPRRDARGRETYVGVRQLLERRHTDLRAIRTRNNINRTILLVGTTASMALALAILAGVPQSFLLAALAFYLVAAITGLLPRLLDQAAMVGDFEDYGLFGSQLLQAVLVSGLAGVAGVLFVTKISTVVVATADPQATIAAAFDLSADLNGLLIAALSGLAPTALLNRLARMSEQMLEVPQPADKGPHAT